MTEYCPDCLRGVKPYKVTASATWVRAYFKCCRMWLVGWSLVRSERLVTK